MSKHVQFFKFIVLIEDTFTCKNAYEFYEWRSPLEFEVFAHSFLFRKNRIFEIRDNKNPFKNNGNAKHLKNEYHK